jgi:6,7-dimethyl-8-ribityllumazine synthase
MAREKSFNEKKSLAIAVADFNSEITERMAAQAEKEAKSRGAEVKKIVHVPGAYDLPIVVASLLARKDIDAVVALGAIIKGETKHDEVIGSATSNQLCYLSIKYKKPVGMGIIGPGATHAQAQARADEYAQRAVKAALQLIDAKKEAEKE